MCTLTNRHDIFVLFDVCNGNPNGDPDAGNMPRIEPGSNRGLVTDVCLKRKVRNYIDSFYSEEEGFDILIKQGNVIETEQKNAEKEAEKNKDIPGSTPDERAKNFLCKKFYDVRAFGGVLSTGSGVMKGSAFGQVRGPIQFTFAQSLDPIVPIEVTITRCTVTKEADKKKERTMGNKHIVPYALYAAKVYISPAFAEKTAFTKRDLELFFEALKNMFENDRSAARGEMVVRAIYDFEHIGTQGKDNQKQNAREAKLGCAPAHKLFETIKAEKKEGKTYPESFSDYNVTCVFEKSVFNGVKLNKIVEP